MWSRVSFYSFLFGFYFWSEEWSLLCCYLCFHGPVQVHCIDVLYFCSSYFKISRFSLILHAYFIYFIYLISHFKLVQIHLSLICIIPLLEIHRLRNILMYGWNRFTFPASKKVLFMNMKFVILQSSLWTWPRWKYASLKRRNLLVNDGTSTYLFGLVAEPILDSKLMKCFWQKCTPL